MIVRAIDYATGDWEYGKGRNDYRRDLAAVTQNIKTRLSSFLGNCFFDQGAGIDWYNLLGAKDQLALNLAISTTILNTEAVTGILQLDAGLDVNRNYSVSFRVQTSYGTSASTFTLDTSIG